MTATADVRTLTRRTIIDLGDITRMLGLANEVALAQVRNAFRLYAPDDMGDLESLIMLGKLEME